MALAPCFFSTAFMPRYIAAEVSSVSRDTSSTCRGLLLPAVRHGGRLVLVRRLPGLVDFDEGHHARSGMPRTASADRPPGLARPGSSTAFMLAEALLRAKGSSPDRACRRDRRVWPSVPPAPWLWPRRNRQRAALLHQFEALDRFDQVLDLRRGHEADVRRLAAKEPRHVNQEPAAAAELEIGVQHRLARFRDRLHHLVPAVHLHRRGSRPWGRTCPRRGSSWPAPVRWPWRRRTRSPGQRLRQLAVDPLHDRPEIEPFVRPVRARLLRSVQRIDDPNLHLAAGLRRKQLSRDSPAIPPPRRTRHNPPPENADGSSGNTHIPSPIHPLVIIVLPTKHMVYQSTRTSP